MSKFCRGASLSATRTARAVCFVEKQPLDLFRKHFQFMLDHAAESSRIFTASELELLRILTRANRRSLIDETCCGHCRAATSQAHPSALALRAYMCLVPLFLTGEQVWPN